MVTGIISHTSQRKGSVYAVHFNSLFCQPFLIKSLFCNVNRAWAAITTGNKIPVKNYSYYYRTVFNRIRKIDYWLSTRNKIQWRKGDVHFLQSRTNMFSLLRNVSLLHFIQYLSLQQSRHSRPAPIPFPSDDSVWRCGNWVPGRRFFTYRGH